MTGEKFLIPEYKIDLLNKSKKIINIVENINSLEPIIKTKKKFVKEKNKQIKKSKVKKVKSIKKIRTLWVRKKKLN